MHQPPLGDVMMAAPTTMSVLGELCLAFARTQNGDASGDFRLSGMRPHKLRKQKRHQHTKRGRKTKRELRNAIWLRYGEINRFNRLAAGLIFLDASLCIVLNCVYRHNALLRNRTDASVSSNALEFIFFQGAGGALLGCLPCLFLGAE